MGIRLEGAVRLPTSLLVTADALGEAFDVTMHSAVVRIVLPALPSDDPGELFSLVAPAGLAVGMGEWMSRAYVDEGGWGNAAFGTVIGQPRILASYVGAVGIEASLVASEVASPDAAQVLGSLFDEWWSDVLMWLERWTPQHLIPDMNAPLRTRGHVEDMRTDPSQWTGWGGGGRVRVYRHASAVTHGMLSAATARAAAGESPPLHWLLLCRAERMLDGRQALLNAGAAAEIALAQRVRASNPAATSDACELMINNANGVVGLVRLVEALDGLPSTGSRRSRIMDRLAGPRNDAAHRGLTPSPEVVQLALHEVRELLGEYAPSPQP